MAYKKRIAFPFTLFLCSLLVGFSGKANIYTFNNAMSGPQQVPPNNSPAFGVTAGYYDDVTNTLTYAVLFSGLTTPATAAHFHAPAAPGVNAPVIIPFTNFPNATFGSYASTAILTDQQEQWLLQGLFYSQIHNATFPGGEIRAQILLSAPLPADVFPFTNIQTGLQENPPNNSPARGLITGTYNNATNTISYTITFTNLTAPATAAHFHAPAAPGQNAPVIIPFTNFPNATAGTYTGTNVLNAQQEMWLLQGLFYSNIHNTIFPGGEIRAQIILGGSAPCVGPSLLNNPTIVLDADCSGKGGLITLIPTSGTAPFMYSIDGGMTYVNGPATGYSFQNLTAGTYQLRTKDARGCESAVLTKEVRKLYGGPLFKNDGTIVLDASCGANDGNISIIPTCGAAPFMYSIDGGVTYVNGPATGYTFQNLAPGTYQLRLKDFYGTESSIVTRQVRPDFYGPCAINTVARPGGKAAQAKDGAASLQAYPNPSKGRFQVQLGRFNAPRVQLQVVDARGAVLQQRTLNAEQTSVVDVDLSGKAKGLYLIRVLSDKGTQQTKVLIQ